MSASRLLRAGRLLPVRVHRHLQVVRAHGVSRHVQQRRQGRQGRHVPLRGSGGAQLRNQRDVRRQGRLRALRREHGVRGAVLPAEPVDRGERPHLQRPRRLPAGDHDSVCALCLQRSDGLPGGLHGRRQTACRRPSAIPRPTTAATWRALGQPCSTTSQCLTGLFCVDGVCCVSSACSLCTSCNVGASAGNCANVPLGSPDTMNRCAANPPCGNTGFCNGAAAASWPRRRSRAARRRARDRRTPRCRTATGRAPARRRRPPAARLTCAAARPAARPVRWIPTVWRPTPARAGSEPKLRAEAERDGLQRRQPVHQRQLRERRLLRQRRLRHLPDLQRHVAGHLHAPGSRHDRARRASARRPSPAATPASATAPAGASRAQSSTPCGPAVSCTGTTYQPASTCTGSGACNQQPTQSCGNYVCSGTMCLTSCTADTQCSSTTLYCTGNTTTPGSCTAKKTNGATCTAAHECTSANCIERRLLRELELRHLPDLQRHHAGHVHAAGGGNNRADGPVRRRPPLRQHRHVRRCQRVPAGIGQHRLRPGGVVRQHHDLPACVDVHGDRHVQPAGDPELRQLRLQRDDVPDQLHRRHAVLQHHALLHGQRDHAGKLRPQERERRRVQRGQRSAAAATAPTASAVRPAAVRPARCAT